MPANYVLLERVTLTASAASVVLDNISQTGYTDLKVVVSARTDYSGGTNDGLSVRFNASNTGYTFRQLYADGTSAASNGGSASVGPNVPATSATANTFGNAEIYIPNYASNNYKSHYIDGVGENNATQAIMSFLAVLWSNTAPITSVTILSSSASNLVANSTFSLYGISALGTTPVLAPKASGGDIVVSDGTYWYHAFLGSGIFTPSQALSCDAIVVAGGGAGGGGGSGGGGGAGGIFVPNTQSLTATNYVVTVGAGGVCPANGNDSQFGTLTLAKGGGAGSIYLGSGGSGGGGYPGENGGTVSQTSTGGTGYGNVGGNGGVFTPPYLSGGGGGSGSAGANGVGSTTGAGGAGLNTWSSWLSATGLGVSGFIAGGGGGGANQQYTGGSAGVAGSGGGGTGGISGGTGTAGAANTGSGGGGSSKQPSGAGTGGSGGSGLVIVRYTVA
jgi:hypothetical protein